MDRYQKVLTESSSLPALSQTYISAGDKFFGVESHSTSLANGPWRICGRGGWSPRGLEGSGRTACYWNWDRCRRRSGCRFVLFDANSYTFDPAYRFSAHQMISIIAAWAEFA